MQPTYLHQYFLPALLPITRAPQPNQPIADSVIDRWLEANKNDALSNDVLIPGYIGLGDVPSDQVLCFIILIANEVSYLLCFEWLIQLIWVSFRCRMRYISIMSACTVFL